ncbi:MAG TPA: lipid kinase [Planctomycetaceae bacterium]|nr:lipid kinase [Planctomycetaceae bacterium]
MTRSALFVVNSKARHGRVGLDDIRRTLTTGGLKLIDASTDQSKDLSALIREHREQVDLIIVGGGDGTVHHALEGLVDCGLPVGILPLGTANDFARTLKLPPDPLVACKVILQGHTSAVDVGRLNGKAFCNVASLGLAVKVTQHLTRETKSRWGVLAYVIAALQSLWNSRPFAVEIEGDVGRFSARSIQVTVGNGRYYGGGLTVDETATANDGILHLYSLEINHWWQLIPLLPALWRGRLRNASNVRTLHGKQFTIRTPGRSHRVVADGEFVGSTPVEFELLPQALNVFVCVPQLD